MITYALYLNFNWLVLFVLWHEFLILIPIPFIDLISRELRILLYLMDDVIRPLWVLDEVVLENLDLFRRLFHSIVTHEQDVNLI